MRYIGAKNGEIRVFEKPMPQIKDNYLLIKTIYSAISPGTELTMGGNSKEDIVQLGYSAAGKVIEVGKGVEGFYEGQYVACYGAPYVAHAEYLLVPKTLCAPVPEGVDLKEASLAGLGAISIHALRKAQLTFGEVAVVVGLGIFGQLIAQIGHGAALEVLPLNRSSKRAELLEEISGIPCYTSEAKLEEALRELTGGKGADGVFLCTGGDSEYLTNKSLEWLRDKGKSIIVGDIQPKYDRELMFGKEIDIMISRAGGPGRYDPSYERDAIDYPYGQVRWTEGRNVKEYIRLLSSKRIRVDKYVGYSLNLDNIKEAYELLQNSGSEVLTGIICYDN
ncbi:zinc-dependent alcohol dehydrogenase [Alloiococcus sp. CFN-8]|uniref:zinc-dependent alcohol dehydrogenase n=1 Tax=Alloiococcus sp. CFN-8 TaxID=3416081 RepID=UPI003CF62A85